MRRFFLREGLFAANKASNLPRNKLETREFARKTCISKQMLVQ